MSLLDGCKRTKNKHKDQSEVEILNKKFFIKNVNCRVNVFLIILELKKKVDKRTSVVSPFVKKALALFCLYIE